MEIWRSLTYVLIRGRTLTPLDKWFYSYKTEQLPLVDCSSNMLHLLRQTRPCKIQYKYWSSSNQLFVDLSSFACARKFVLICANSSSCCNFNQVITLSMYLMFDIEWLRWKISLSGEAWLRFHIDISKILIVRCASKCFRRLDRHIIMYWWEIWTTCYLVKYKIEWGCVGTNSSFLDNHAFNTLIRSSVVSNFWPIQVSFSTNIFDTATFKRGWNGGLL